MIKFSFNKHRSASHSVLLLHFILYITLSNTSDLNKDDIKRALRPLKYSNNCGNFCGKISCYPVEECNEGTIVKNTTYCGCCEACVKFLDVGESCINDESQRRCKKGTTCENGKCTLNIKDKSCLRHRYITENYIKKENYTSEVWIPQCDEEGHYTAKQKKITKSICVDMSGERIYGNPEDLPEHNCACSRLMKEKEKSERISFFVTPHEHCVPSGSFDTLQCINNLCYCADEKTGDIKSELVHIEFLENLPCYDTKKHNKDYLQACELELQRTKKLAYEFLKKGVEISGLDIVKCDPDGTYSPKQCLPDRCVCTNKEGIGIRQYYAELAKVLAVNMTCNCARDEATNLYVGLNGLSCETYGSYKKVTCDDGKCLCVDKDGEIISTYLNVTDKGICDKLEYLLDGSLLDDDTDPSNTDPPTGITSQTDDDYDYDSK